MWMRRPMTSPTAGPAGFPRRPSSLIALVGALGAGAIGLVSPPRATAAAKPPAVDLVCLFSAQLNFTPALNFNTTSASLIGLLSSCVSPNGSQPRLKSAVIFNTSDTIARGCAPAPLTVTSDSNTGLWNDGTKSIFDLDISTDPTNGKLGFNARVTSGSLSGTSVVSAPVLLFPHGLCLFGGERSLNLSFGALAFTHTSALGTPVAAKKARQRRCARRAGARCRPTHR
jgi:hypothetical protein